MRRTEPPRIDEATSALHRWEQPVAQRAVLRASRPRCDLGDVEERGRGIEVVGNDERESERGSGADEAEFAGAVHCVGAAGDRKLAVDGGGVALHSVV